MSNRRKSLTLVSHNAYWFQGAPSLWGEECTRAHPAVVQALAELYAELDPDVLCLQEVPSCEIAAALCAELGMEGAFFPGGKRTAYGGAILWQDPAARVENLDCTAGDECVFERICLKLDTCIGDRSLSIVDVHLCSNRYAPDRLGEPLRLAELEALFDVCAAPDVVLGDFNATPDSAVYARMVERGFADSGCGHAEHGRPQEKRIDYIWIRIDSGLFVSEYEVIQDERFLHDAAADVYLSDPHPVRVRLRL